MVEFFRPYTNKSRGFMAVIIFVVELTVASACRNPSFWGKVCFLSTPDGENCGLVKNLAVTGLVSTKLIEVPLEKLASCGMEHLGDDSLQLSGKHKILLNGNWVGVCRDSSLFVKKFKNLRRSKQIDSKVFSSPYSCAACGCLQLTKCASWLEHRHTITCM